MTEESNEIPSISERFEMNRNDGQAHTIKVYMCNLRNTTDVVDATGEITEMENRISAAIQLITDCYFSDENDKKDFHEFKTFLDSVVRNHDMGIMAIDEDKTNKPIIGVLILSATSQSYNHLLSEPEVEEDTSEKEKVETDKRYVQGWILCVHKNYNDDNVLAEKLLNNSTKISQHVTNRAKSMEMLLAGETSSNAAEICGFQLYKKLKQRGSLENIKYRPTN